MIRRVARLVLVLPLCTFASCTTGPILLSQEVTPLLPASRQPEAVWDGAYTGSQTPDVVQDNTRAKCLLKPVTRTVTITASKAAMVFGDATANGGWEADGNFHLTTPNRTITLTPSLDPKTNKRSMFGRLLAGGGPWCKYTFRLEEVP